MIGAVFTKETERRHGYATVVITELCRYYLKEKKKGLALFWENPAAGSIYTKLGFVEKLGDWNMNIFHVKK